MVLIDLMIPMRRASGKYYVYLFVMEGTDYYKIGYTNHIYKRLSAVNTSSPQAVACIQYYEFTHEHQAVAFEKYLHKNFASKRIRNRMTNQPKEWFILNMADISQISHDYQDFTAYRQREIKPMNSRLEEVYIKAIGPKPVFPTFLPIIKPAAIPPSVSDIIQVSNLNKLTKSLKQAGRD